MPPARRGLARLLGLHRDERGTISIITVIALMIFTLLMGMVINVGRHVDDKVKQQNAVDAATFSGGVMLTRGMNSLAFSNHLLCDVFALTAFMREGRDRNSEKLTEDVLAAWSKVGPMFAKSPYRKFTGLGQGIQPKVDAEKEMVRAFSEFGAGLSEITLPTLEEILRQKLIPQFQSTLVQTVPGIAQQTMADVARRHSAKPVLEFNKRGPAWGVLWRMNVQPVGYSNEQDPMQRTLPAVDPDPSGPDYSRVPAAQLYLQTAISERERLSKKYLDDWNGHILALFPKYAQMSQFFGLWQIFTYGQLCKLLNEEYPTTNLPFQIRRTQDGTAPEDLRQAILSKQRPPVSTSPLWLAAKPYLEQNFRFAGVAYRKSLNEVSGKLFQNQLQADGLTLAEVAIFIPEPRYVHVVSAGGQQPTGATSGGSLFGATLPADPGGTPQTSGPVNDWVPEIWPPQWSLLSQNWTVQLVPATADSLVQILQTQPEQFAPAVNIQSQITVPRLGPLTPSQMRKLNTH